MSDNILNTIKTYEIVKFSKLSEENDSIQSFENDKISPESPLEIRLKKQGQSAAQNIAITMRSPGNDIELALGFLFTENIISSIEQIFEIKQTNEHIIEITCVKNLDFDLNKIQRNFYTSSSCGICSKGSLESLHFDSNYLPWMSKAKISPNTIYTSIDVFENTTPIFKQTGGLHAVALLDLSGNTIQVFEDIGRHNAMDKMVGYGLKNNLMPFSNLVILLSGRISFELVQKAAMAGTPIIIAKGAPSDLAIDEAKAQKICLIGFLKQHSFNVYSAIERIKNGQ